MRQSPAPRKPAVKREADAPRRKSWLQRKWDGLQKQAEEARRIESQRKKAKSRR